MKPLLLLPHPQHIEYRTGTCSLTGGRLITIRSRETIFAAQRLQRALAGVGVHWDIAMWSAHIPDEQIGIRFSPAMPRQSGAYELDISTQGISISSAEPAGVWYGVCTLVQIIDQCGTALPRLKIDDYPDFPRRGVMLDVSRDKVPTMDTLYELIDRLAAWKINEVQLYTEHTFAYRAHRTVWEHASPMTAEQVMALDAFCKARFVDLVPNQNSFGHMHRWLMHEEYAHLAEAPEGLPWDFMLTPPRPFSISPAVPDSITLIEGLFDELLPNFSSQYFNIGCDETFDLGRGRSKELVEKEGKGRVYLNFIKQVAAAAQKHHRIVQFWGDIIIDYPDLVSELPNDLIALEWGYDADHPFDKHSAIFARSGIQFYVCPGTSSWLSLIGRTRNARLNLLSAAENGKKHGAIGYLNTDWGDFGHLQMLPSSYLGFAYGAALSWALEPNRDADLPAVLSRYAFEDPTGIMGALAVELGDVYLNFDEYPNRNSHTTVRALFQTIDRMKKEPFNGMKEPIRVDTAKMRRVMAKVNKLAARLDQAQPADPRVVPEYKLAVRLWLHACKRLLMVAGDRKITKREMALELRDLLSAYSTCWLARNRPGGLGDSMTRLTRLLAEYES